MAFELIPMASPGGVPFIDYVQARVGRRSAQRVLAYIQEWDVLADELGAEPTLQQYQERWKMSRATAYNDQRLFQQAFPDERTPRHILDSLWRLHAASSGPLLAAKVAVNGGQTFPIDVGQFWIDKPEAAFHRVLSIEGSNVHAERFDSHNPLRTTSLPAAAFAGFRLVGRADDDLWAVAVQLDVDPGPILPDLARSDFIIDRVSQPSPDWGGSRRPRAATMQLRGVARDEASIRRAVYDVLAPLGVTPHDVAMRLQRLTT
jgi:hypothetical protein